MRSITPASDTKAKTIRVISWNLNGRKNVSAQILALHDRRPDVIALQEVKTTTAAALETELRKVGLRYCTNSFSLAKDLSLLKGPRQYGELIASRWPLSSPHLKAFPVPWTERVLSAVIESTSCEIEIHTVGMPPGASNGWTKVEMFEGIYQQLACASERLRILCGDFNSPQSELSDGEIVTWGQYELKGRFLCWRCWRGGTGERWDRGERNVLRGLADFDLPDVYRALHGYGRDDFTWYWKGRGRSVGRRFDHIFASHKLNPVRCEYLHSLREAGLSDHSPIEVDFVPGGFAFIGSSANS
jgi:exodeoxyribonuclease III